MGDNGSRTDYLTTEQAEQRTTTHSSDESSDVNRYIVGIETAAGRAHVDRHARTVVRDFDFEQVGSAIVCEATDEEARSLESCPGVRYVEQDRPRYPVVLS